MNYKDFKQIIDWQITHHNKIYSAYKLKIDLLEAFEDNERVIDALWKQILDENGMQWLSWYLYEKDGISGNPKKDFNGKDADGKEICKDLKGLHDYLVKEKYFMNDKYTVTKRIWHLKKNKYEQKNNNTRTFGIL